MNNPNRDQTYTPERPMYPEVRLRHNSSIFVLRDVAVQEIRRKCGHNAADWFTRAATEFDSYDDLLYFIRSTVRVS